ncbi:MAG: hypothetical protein WCP73_09935, partial [Eubacteriales bacterium]
PGVFNSMANSTITNEDYNRFSLSILADNALIIRNALSPEEETEAKLAKALADKLDALAETCSKSATEENNKKAFEAAQEARKFFLQILTRMLTIDFHIDLKQTTVNLFASEAEKYMDVLSVFMKGGKPEYDITREEVFWLPIFTIQCRYIADGVGYFQKRNREKANDLASVFNEYWAYSSELLSMERVGEASALLADAHHVAVADLLREYYEFLTSIIFVLRQKRMPGSLSLLYLDRARRMVCFYLKIWAFTVNESVPDCNPYAKRISIY